MATVKPGMSLKSKVPDAECPSCHEYMGFFNHGTCEACGERCGCSFNPTNSNDYCEDHRAR